MNVIKMFEEYEQQRPINKMIIRAVRTRIDAWKLNILVVLNEHKRKGKINELLFVYFSRAASIFLSKGLQFKSIDEYATGLDCLCRSFLYMLKMHDKVKRRPPKFLRDLFDNLFKGEEE